MASPKLHIFMQFPDESHQLTYWMAMDPDFYDLCQDFEACIEALHYWSASNDPHAGVRSDEYRNILTELKQEIVKVLKTLKQKH